MTNDAHGGPHQKPTDLDANMRRAEQLRDELFDLANSFAGDAFGIVAVQLHAACNAVHRARQSYDTLRPLHHHAIRS